MSNSPLWEVILVMCNTANAGTNSVVYANVGDKYDGTTVRLKHSILHPNDSFQRAGTDVFPDLNFGDMSVNYRPSFFTLTIGGSDGLKVHTLYLTNLTTGDTYTIDNSEKHQWIDNGESKTYSLHSLYQEAFKGQRASIFEVIMATANITNGTTGDHIYMKAIGTDGISGPVIRISDYLDKHARHQGESGRGVAELRYDGYANISSVLLFKDGSDGWSFKSLSLRNVDYPDNPDVLPVVYQGDPIFLDNDKGASSYDYLTFAELKMTPTN